LRPSQRPAFAIRNAVGEQGAEPVVLTSLERLQETIDQGGGIIPGRYRLSRQSTGTCN
jgi:hypothetical protein